MKRLLTYIIIVISITTVSFAHTADSSNLNTITSQIDNHQIEIEKLKTIQDVYDKKVNLLLIGLALLLTLGTGFSVFGFIRAENRETKAFKLTLESVQESKQASIESKDRENKILAESQKTLSLVNDTLTLATEASKRASKSLEIRLRKSILKLEADSKEVIEYSGAFEDDKNLTTDKAKCSDIHRLGRKIEGIENNLVILGDASFDSSEGELYLKPYCNFVRGTDAYLSEQFSEALDYWNLVTNSYEAEKKLKSLAFFWIGYVNNNLGDFTRAINSFKRAYELATDSREFELHRIQLETQFFNQEPIKEIVEKFKILLSNIEKSTYDDTFGVIELRKTKILTTLGNVYYQWGNQLNNEESKIYYKESKNIFADILNLSNEGNILDQIFAIPESQKDKYKWVIFGFVEALYKLSETKEEKEIARTIYKDIVHVLAENEFLNREEKRTKVLAKTTQLICAIRCEDSNNTISNLKSQVDNILGDIDKRLTVYSQIQRRNVKRERFRNDLEIILPN